jgi:antitoxin VapB
MALSIKNSEVERLARELAAKTDESITDAVLIALRERLARQDSERDRDRFVERIGRIGDDVHPHLIADPRSDDEIIGYDEHGLPT